MKYLLLFDIDGTLLKFKTYNSREIFSNMMQDIFGREVPISLMPDFSGMTDLQILKEISIKISLDISVLHQKIDQVWEKISNDFSDYCNPDYIDILPGVNELLKKLSKNNEISLGLQTGNFKKNAYSKLKAYDLDKYFSFGAFGSDYEDRNLLPQLAIKRANNYFNSEFFTCKNTIVIGDSLRDIECAKSNNLPVLAVATGTKTVQELTLFNPDAVFFDFSDHECVIESIFEVLNKHNEKN